MARTLTRTRSLDLAQMLPGNGLTPIAEGWHVGLNSVEFTSDAILAPGWYRLRVSLRSTSRLTLRKRAEITFSEGESESLSWNDALGEETMFELPRGAIDCRITLLHAVGDIEVNEFRLKRVSGPALSMAAMREKLRLLKAYQCLGPVLLRGGKLLMKARFFEFHRRILKGLRDSRVMLSVDGNAPAMADESASWNHRHSLPTEEAKRVRDACDAMIDPPFFAVLMPVNDSTFLEARQALRAIRRQIYPHWELLIAGCGSKKGFAEFAAQAKLEKRIRVAWADERDGLPVALGRAVALAEAERVLVLPPTAELAEDGLYQWANCLAATRSGAIENVEPIAPLRVAAKQYVALRGTLLGGLSGSDTETQPIWLTRLDKLPDDAPASLAPEALAAWATANIDEAQRSSSKAIAYPLDERPLLDRARIGGAPKVAKQTLFMATDLIGINGWGHVAYAVLRGMPSFGVEFLQHPATRVKADLLPTAFVPEVKTRHFHDKQLAIVPPFLLHRFNPDKCTALFTMWETDTIPPACVESLNRTGLVMVPSPWNLDNFRRCGVTVPMEVVPLGFDRTTYSADGSFPKVCTFGTAGALSAGGLRKNVTKVIELFRKAFPTETDVRLRVKISPDSSAVETFDDPRIDLVQAILPHSEMLAWYRSLSAFVNTSFGEGFGLHLIEAMACGRPLITPNYSGLTTFFEPQLGYAVDYELQQVNNEIYTGCWAVPAEDSIVKAMRGVYADREEAKRLGELSATKVKRFHWKHAGRKLHAALVKHGFLASRVA
jgi:glycosyltransferase involved in cell wall biosynthesis